MARAVCPRCERPVSTCLCATLPSPPLAHRTELLILQHPAEAGHAKNTAALTARDWRFLTSSRTPTCAGSLPG